MTNFLSGPQAMDFTFGNLLTIVAMLMGLVASYVALLRSFDARFSVLALQISKILEGDVRELRLRVASLESGTEGWTKDLRERGHHLAELLNAITLKVDRLEHMPGNKPIVVVAIPPNADEAKK